MNDTNELTMLTDEQLEKRRAETWEEISYGKSMGEVDMIAAYRRYADIQGERAHRLQAELARLRNLEVWFALYNIAAELKKLVDESGAK